MRKFSWFYFDNYSDGDVKSPADDPRFVLGEAADGILTEMVEAAPGKCSYDGLCSRYSPSQVDSLIRIGLFRQEGEAVLLDAPVFVREDADRLSRCFSASVEGMAKILTERKEEFYRLAGAVSNGFPPEVNLYHLLCGAVFDGEFFEFLSRRNIVSTSRVHLSGLDYLLIGYEQSEALDGFSQKLLCSYNRFSDGARTLQSFGDADGDRMDFFRFARQRQLGKVPKNLKYLEALWDSMRPGEILEETEGFVETGRCGEGVCRLLMEFGYVRQGKVAVPVYRRMDLPVIQKLEELTERCIAEEMSAALGNPAITAGLTCSRHGVAAGEIANELYHVVFGQLNEVLTAGGFAAEPPRIAGQGRFLKSIELM